ncbi:hypothetical protein VPH35_129043 [Triticum aestivum]
MNETTSPLPESWYNVFESLIIPHFPNIPPRKENQFSKERFVELLSCLQSSMCHVIVVCPNYLKLVPYSNTENIVEEKMISIFQGQGWTKDTFCTFFYPSGYVFWRNIYFMEKPPKYVSGIMY